MCWPWQCRDCHVTRSILQTANTFINGNVSNPSEKNYELFIYLLWTRAAAKMTKMWCFPCKKKKDRLKLGVCITVRPTHAVPEQVGGSPCMKELLSHLNKLQYYEFHWRVVVTHGPKRQFQYLLHTHTHTHTQMKLCKNTACVLFCYKSYKLLEIYNKKKKNTDICLQKPTLL